MHPLGVCKVIVTQVCSPAVIVSLRGSSSNQAQSTKANHNNSHRKVTNASWNLVNTNRAMPPLVIDLRAKPRTVAEAAAARNAEKVRVKLAGPK